MTKINIAFFLFAHFKILILIRTLSNIGKNGIWKIKIVKSTLLKIIKNIYIYIVRVNINKIQILMKSNLGQFLCSLSLIDIKKMSPVLPLFFYSLGLPRLGR